MEFNIKMLKEKKLASPELLLLVSGTKDNFTSLQEFQKFSKSLKKDIDIESIPEEYLNIYSGDIDLLEDSIVKEVYLQDIDHFYFGKEKEVSLTIVKWLDDISF
ncbi:hypothetical protein AYI69_g4120 [Smittium culicis]|uniref:Uncharacterized protein n=1 Tax=Smittium culicis TaxID=133412 RepID=A0A1R1YGA8_9FUNG|nr:hypothetical protein AYI69_g4120 [Smittium culicis]